VILLEARRAEDRHARSDEVKGAEAANELDHDAQRSNELYAAGLRALEEAPNLRGRPMPPGFWGGRLSCRLHPKPRHRKSLRESAGSLRLKWDTHATAR
jgi:hypothetical protein